MTKVSHPSLADLTQRNLCNVLEYLPQRDHKKVAGTCRNLRALCQLNILLKRARIAKEEFVHGHLDYALNKAISWRALSWPCFVNTIQMAPTMEHYSGPTPSAIGERIQDLMVRMPMSAVLNAQFIGFSGDTNKHDELDNDIDASIPQLVPLYPANVTDWIPLAGILYESIECCIVDGLFADELPAGSLREEWETVCAVLRDAIDASEQIDKQCLLKVIEAPLRGIGDGNVYIADSSLSSNSRLNNVILRFVMEGSTKASDFFLFISSQISRRTHGIEIKGYDKQHEGARLVLDKGRCDGLRLLNISGFYFGNPNFEDDPQNPANPRSASSSPPQILTSEPNETLSENLLNERRLIEAMIREDARDNDSDSSVRSLEGRLKPIQKITQKYFPSLEHLKLTSNHEVISIYDLPNLKSIDLEDCQGVMFLGQVGRTCNSLTTLSLNHCDKLHHALEPFGRHKKLRWLKLIDMVTPMVAEIGNFQHLEGLEISGCPELESIAALPSLKTLKIENCPHLRFGTVSDDRFPKIESLHMKNIASLMMISRCSSLREAEIYFDPEESSGNLRAVTECPNLRTFLMHPMKLTLIIKHCPRLDGWDTLKS